MIITIDGLTGTGKSTIAKLLAEYFNISYINTGLFYRIIGYLLINILKYEDSNYDENIAKDLCNVLNKNDIVIDLTSGSISYKGNHLNNVLYDENITKLSTLFSQDQSLRMVINNLIIESIEDLDVILEGRDCAINITPNADYKILLVSNENQRFERVIQSRKNYNYESLYFIDEINKKVTPSLDDVDVYDYIYDTSDKGIDKSFDDIKNAIHEFFKMKGVNLCQ